MPRQPFIPGRTAVEHFIHPDTGVSTTTRHPVRTLAESARLRRLVDRLNPDREWTATRLINGVLTPLVITAATAAEAGAIADVIHASRQRKDTSR